MLDTLLQQQQYIGLEYALAADATHLSFLNLAYFEGVMANHTNQVTRSIRLLEPLLPALFASNPGHAELALCTLADDYAKSFRYGDAARTYGEANRFAQRRAKDSQCDAGREAARWAMLSGAPVQTVGGSATFTVGGQRNALGLFEAPITAGNYSGWWIVDSGANLSVISRSVADKMGLQLSSSLTSAEGATGAAMAIHTATIPEIRLGQAVLHNVAVLVIEDSDLTFPDMAFHIEGNVGLPVLAALGRITFHPDGRLDFSRSKEPNRSSRRSTHNLFLDKFTPLLAADLGHGNELFTLDTGAMGTILSAQFYRDNRTALEPANLIALHLQGAGGTLVSSAYVIRNVVAKLGRNCSEVDSIQVLTESTGLSDEFYGNIGQSALSSFSSFTLDFNNMQFSAAGGKPGKCYAGRWQ